MCGIRGLRPLVSSLSTFYLYIHITPGSPGGLWVRSRAPQAARGDMPGCRWGRLCPTLGSPDSAATLISLLLSPLWQVMDFTEIYKQTAGLVAFSPGAHFILTAVEDRVVVRRADSFQITRTWQISESPAVPEVTAQPKPSSSANPASLSITHAGWSSDSEYILAACVKRGVVEVFKLRDETFNARIDCGTEGLVKAEWTPDGRSILCFSEWGVRPLILTATACGYMNS